MVLLTLFLGAFLAATILPFSSEVMLATALAQEAAPIWGLVGIASLGNVLGAIVNYGLGAYLTRFADRRWFPVTQTQLDKAADRFQRWGQWSMLLAFLPIIGDPLTLVAGLMRMRFSLFLVLVAIGKTARYAAIGLAF